MINFLNGHAFDFVKRQFLFELRELLPVFYDVFDYTSLYFNLLSDDSLLSVFRLYYT